MNLRNIPTTDLRKELRRREELQRKRRRTTCPDCKKRTLGLASGGGAKCENPNCDYWECY